MTKQSLLKLVNDSPLSVDDKIEIEELINVQPDGDLPNEIIEEIYIKVLAASNRYLESIGAADPTSDEEKNIVAEYEAEMKEIEDDFKNDMEMVTQATTKLNGAIKEIEDMETQEEIERLRASVQQ